MEAIWLAKLPTNPQLHQITCFPLKLGKKCRIIEYGGIAQLGECIHRASSSNCTGLWPRCAGREPHFKEVKKGTCIIGVAQENCDYINWGPTMPNYLEILRLDSLNHSQRTIESTVHCSRHTVRSVLQATKEKQIAWPLNDDITNAELEEILFPGKYKSVYRYVEPDYPYIHRELAKPGVTMALLWEEYCRKCHEAGETPYMSTQFGDKYRRWARVTKATMRIQHKPGDAIQVDWAGDTLPVHDPVTGEQSSAYLFVAVLPCSSYTYAESFRPASASPRTRARRKHPCVLRRHGSLRRYVSGSSSPSGR